MPKDGAFAQPALSLFNLSSFAHFDARYEFNPIYMRRSPLAYLRKRKQRTEFFGVNNRR